MSREEVRLQRELDTLREELRTAVGEAAVDRAVAYVETHRRLRHAQEPYECTITDKEGHEAHYTTQRTDLLGQWLEEQFGPEVAQKEWATIVIERR